MLSRHGAWLATSAPGESGIPEWPGSSTLLVAYSISSLSHSFAARLGSASSQETSRLRAFKPADLVAGLDEPAHPRLPLRDARARGRPELLWWLVGCMVPSTACG